MTDRPVQSRQKGPAHTEPVRPSSRALGDDSHSNAETISISQPLQRGAAVGRYSILAQVGEGGMGVVYAARDPELHRTVAIKLLRADDASFGPPHEQQQRLLREAQAMAKISHPNVIAVYDVGTIADGVFVAMEFVDGKTMREWIREEPRPWHQVLNAFVSAGRGLAAAHAAGLVHGDFKPENVLVGKDGSVRVMDFGLARMTGGGHDDSEPSGRSSGGNADRTEDAVVVGTPRYMAPEQHAGTLADARSDQFSFCAALYWGVFRKRPYNHRTLAAAVHLQLQRGGPARVQELIAEPPQKPRLPVSVRRALMRGLAADPEQRFPSMDGLLAALDYQPTRQRRRLYAAGAASAVLVAGLLSYRQVLRARELTCNGASGRLAGVWDGPARESVDHAFRQSGHPAAPQILRQVQASMDRYAQSWVATHEEACRATRVRGDQSEQVLSLRMVCLDRRLKEFKALVGVLASADVGTVGNAFEAAQGLQGPRACADAQTLLGQTPIPDDAAARATVEQVQTLLAQVKAQHDAGRFLEARPLAEQALRLAQAARYRPLEAEALYWTGWLQALSGGDAKAAEELLVRATHAAQAGRDDLTMIRAAVKLVYVVGVLEGRYAAAHSWEGMIRATLERIGGDQEQESQMLSNLGSVLLLEGKPEDAQKSYERALQLAPADEPQRGKILSNLATVALAQRRYGDAIQLSRQALEVIARTGGPDHLGAAYARYALARAYLGQGDFEGAQAELARAVPMFEAALGSDHRQVSDALDVQSEVMRAQGRYLDAAETSTRALQLKEKALGLRHPDLAPSLVGLGQSELGTGQPRRAVAQFERAMALPGADVVSSAEASFGLAQALSPRGAPSPRSKELARGALRVFRDKGRVDEAARVSDWLSAHR